MTGRYSKRRGRPSTASVCSVSDAVDGARRALRPSRTQASQRRNTRYTPIYRNLTVSRINQVWARRHHIHPDGARLPIPGGGHRLVFSDGCSPGACPTRWRRPSASSPSDRSCSTLRSPEIFNKDPGSCSPRKSSPVYCLLLRPSISMDGKGRCTTTSSWSGSGARWVRGGPPVRLRQRAGWLATTGHRLLLRLSGSMEGDAPVQSEAIKRPRASTMDCLAR